MRNPFPINAQTHDYCGPNRFEEREKREEQLEVMAERIEQYLAGDLDWKELVRRAELLKVDDSTLNRMVRFQQELKEAKTSPRPWSLSKLPDGNYNLLSGEGRWVAYIGPNKADAELILRAVNNL